MNISLVTITDGAHLDNLLRTVNSVRDLVQEVVIIYQGSNQFTYEKIREISDFSHKMTYKGNADPDRNYAYVIPQSEWILALDDDEWVPDDTKKFIGRIIYTPADVVWFKFKNLVDGVDISDILGDDPHPRLWRKRDGLIAWPEQAHAFPQINSGMQYFAGCTIVHDRRYEDLVKRHEQRGKVVDPNNQQIEKNFLEAVKRKLGKK